MQNIRLHELLNQIDFLEGFQGRGLDDVYNGNLLVSCQKRVPPLTSGEVRKQTICCHNG